ncbi:uncharacterized protein BO80DRAFT_291128 [Aspergillus ibericus CBS 121593]|uniref:Uncharacterized protein n=1 Tax=Aspergillus ibericus CBS 121593 TaxID=1448316 RepID=A0A395GJL3_9EURO|nr:hypothetical protein BO80DRAFT_291128 [Aspergillus ibericus CBS 121593]RAK94947.1 hypothetical protein BO80DRAFT_291128 [Aspergillus ibericus CBS 121593]
MLPVILRRPDSLFHQSITHITITATYSCSTKTVGPAFDRMYMFVASALTGGLPERRDTGT